MAASGSSANPALATYKSGKSGVLDDNTNIDSTTFDAERHFKNLLRSKSIDELLKADNELRKEIKALDGSMKTLVHNNYQKFIAAAVTLRKMNTNIESMESEMSRLQSNIERIEKYSTTISEHLSGKRAEIEQLSGVHSLLEQLHFLSEVPKKLSMALKEEIPYSEAIEYYHSTAHILKKYSHIPSFNQIKSNSEKLIADIKKALLDKFDVQENDKLILQYCQLLQQLGETLRSLRERFGMKRREMMHGILYKWKNFVVNPATPGEPKAESYKRFITNLNKDFLPPFSAFVRLFTVLFVERGTHVEEEESAEALDEHVNGMLQQYVDTVSQHLLQSGSPEAMIMSLNLIGQELSDAHTNLPHLHLAQRAERLVTSITAALIGHHFDTFLRGFDEAIVKMGEELAVKDAEQNVQPKFYEELLVKVQREFTNGIDALIVSIKPLFADLQSQNVIASITSKISGVIATMNTNVLRYRNVEEKTIPSKSFLLVLTRLWLRIDANCVSLIDEKLRPLLSAVGAGNKGIDTKVIKDGLTETAQSLLEYYVQSEAERIGQMIRKAVETSNWLNRKEPRDVEMIIEMLLDEIRQLQNHLELAYRVSANEVSGAPAGKATPAPTRTTVVRPSIGLGIGLFTKKMQFFGKVDFERGSILMAIIKICLKTWLECVRLTTFATHGYQQIQVNTTFMRMGLAEYMEDKQLLSYMIDEILASAEERTIDPVPMEPSIIERICNDKIKKKT